MPGLLTCGKVQNGAPFSPDPGRRSAFLPSPILGLNVPELEGIKHSVLIGGSSWVQSQLHSQKSLSKPGAPAVQGRVQFCLSESSFWSHWKCEIHQGVSPGCRLRPEQALGCHLQRTFPCVQEHTSGDSDTGLPESEEIHGCVRSAHITASRVKVRGKPALPGCHFAKLRA